MKLLKKRVGKRIQARRKEMGFKTQSDLAAVLGTDQPTIARWETGLYFPSDEYLEKLMEALKVDKDFFFNEETWLKTDVDTLFPILNRKTYPAISEHTDKVLSQLESMADRIDQLEEGVESLRKEKAAADREIARLKPNPAKDAVWKALGKVERHRAEGALRLLGLGDVDLDAVFEALAQDGLTLEQLKQKDREDT